MTTDYKGDKKLELHYDEIVVGCSLASLLYCFWQRKPFIYIEKLIPEKDETYGGVIPLRKFWEKVILLNTHFGNNIYGDKVASIEIKDNNTLIVQLKDFSTYTIKFDKLSVFDTFGLTGIDIGTEKIQYRVYDLFRVSLGANKYIEVNDTENEFVYHTRLASPEDEEIHFRRIISVSKLDEDELEDPSFNHTSALIKTKRMFKNTEIKGRTSKQTKLKIVTENGVKRKEYSYFTYSRPIVVKPYLRKIKRLNCKSVEDTETIKFMRYTPEEVYKEFFEAPPYYQIPTIKYIFGETHGSRRAAETITTNYRQMDDV
jgi:hypothetical protein